MVLLSVALGYPQLVYDERYYDAAADVACFMLCLKKSDDTDANGNATSTNNLALVMALALVLLLVLVMLLALAIQHWYSTKVADADAVVACFMCLTNCSGFAIAVMVAVVMTSGCYGSFVVQDCH